ncbi:MAG TPA: single-stranded DNA-binding protein [Candidatus Brocadiia bacterium]|nr:single-stranded DNA-binding protein [Candidatus Brocadiia bacterium]
MSNFNKVLLMGNLTRDPELRYTPSGQAVAQFGLAVNRRYKGQDGQQKEEACFVDCEAWARSAEVLCQYMSKGRPLFVEGRLKLDAWEDQSGQKRSKLKVVVENFQFIGGRADAPDGAPQSRPMSSPGGQRPPQRPQQQQSQPPMDQEADMQPPPPDDDVPDNDIPF